MYLLIRMPLSRLGNLVNLRVTRETLEGRSSARAQTITITEGRAIPPARTLIQLAHSGSLCLPRSLVNYHESNILLGVLDAVPKIVGDKEMMVLSETEPELPLKWYQGEGFDSPKCP